MSDLLSKTRRINRLAAGGPVRYDEMAKVLRDVIGANVYLANQQGELLGYALMNEFQCEIIEKEVLKQGYFSPRYNEKLIQITETLPNLLPERKGRCVIDDEQECFCKEKITTIVPISGGGERLGTMVLARFKEEFTDDDLVLAEYGATVVGMEIWRARAEKCELDTRKRAAVQVALSTLSYSELEAIEHIFEELGGNEGLLVASKIADRVGITRSVIVNALRKFESAGVIESRSLGMKGTYIRVLNEYLPEELSRLTARRPRA